MSTNKSLPSLTFWKPVRLDPCVTFHTQYDNYITITVFIPIGTTWVQEVVWQIFNGGEISIKPAFERVPFLEMLTHPRAEHVDINTLPSPRIIKTHLTYHATPKDENEETRCKYIYVARNPKDVDGIIF